MGISFLSHRRSSMILVKSTFAQGYPFVLLGGVGGLVGGDYDEEEKEIK